MRNAGFTHGATYRAISAAIGVSDKKNVRQIVRSAEAAGLMKTTYADPRSRRGLATVRLTEKSVLLSNVLLRVVPLSELHTVQPNENYQKGAYD